MCSKLTSLVCTKKRYAYKMVGIVQGVQPHSMRIKNIGVRSPYWDYYWTKGKNVAVKSEFLGQPKLERNWTIGIGYFHCINTLKEARMLLQQSPPCSKFYPNRIIKVRLGKRQYAVKHIGCSKAIDEKMGTIATEVYWDGKFVK